MEEVCAVVMLKRYRSRTEESNPKIVRVEYDTVPKKACVLFDREVTNMPRVRASNFWFVVRFKAISQWVDWRRRLPFCRDSKSVVSHCGILSDIALLLGFVCHAERREHLINSIFFFFFFFFIHQIEMHTTWLLKLGLMWLYRGCCYRQVAVILG